MSNAKLLEDPDVLQPLHGRLVKLSQLVGEVRQRQDGRLSEGRTRIAL